MKQKLISLILVILTLMGCLLVNPALALEVEIGQQVELKATKPIGVPLHERASSSLKGRLSDGTIASVVDTDDDKRWLKIETDDQQGWIVEKYVAQVLGQSPPPIPPTPPIIPDDGTTVWSSKGACRAIVDSGQRLPRSQAQSLRLASWNILWFPDGVPGNRNDSDQKTDLDWLSCTIAWMDVDVLAVQEIKTTSSANEAWKQVTSQLNQDTDGDWQVILNDCGSPTNQHNGFLYNANKVKPTQKQEVWQFNGRAKDASESCKDNLRPGYMAYFEPITAPGFDFYAVSVHSDSGRNDKDLTTRRTAIERIDEVTKDLANIDGDIIILGDFNTMGIEGGITAQEEIKELENKVKTEIPGFRLLSLQPSCSYYFRKRPSRLDHILVSSDSKELINTQAISQGYCAINNCQRINGDLPSSARRLSDHCPIIADFSNSDIDD
ncbi:MAG: endonuclease/exonuclease/phosphatase family protein [Crocosphaera sp.]